MPYSLNEFLSDIRTRGTIRKSRFDVVIKDPLPTNKTSLGSIISTAIGGAISGGISGALTGVAGLFKNNSPLTLRCESVTLPGVQILTSPLKLYGGIPALNLPKNREYDTIQCTFISSKSFVEKQYFENWINEITDFSTNNVSYYKDICHDIQINIYDDGNLGTDTINALLSKIPGPITQIESTVNNFVQNITGESIMGPTTLYSVELLDAIPTRVEEVELAWEESDQILKFTVVFSFRQIKYTKQKYNEFFDYQNKTF